MEEWKLEAEKSKAKEDKKRRKRLKGTYIGDYLQDRMSKTLEELGILENDLVELERYEEAKLVTGKMKELKKILNF